MSLEVISTKKAPAAIGPYSQGIKMGDLVFTSGQLHFNPETGELVDGDIKDLARLSLNNLKAVLEEAGSSLEDVIKVTVFVTDISKFGEVNEVYGEFFDSHKPARSCVEVSALPAGGQVEIEAIAKIK